MPTIFLLLITFTASSFVQLHPARFTRTCSPCWSLSTFASVQLAPSSHARAVPSLRYILVTTFSGVSATPRTLVINLRGLETRGLTRFLGHILLHRSLFLALYRLPTPACKLRSMGGLAPSWHRDRPVAPLSCPALSVSIERLTSFSVVSRRNCQPLIQSPASSRTPFVLPSRLAII